MDWGFAAFVLAVVALAISIFGLFVGRKKEGSR